jgi:long-subunit fatty acid transport protein
MSHEHGGLQCTMQEIGFAQGTVGVIAFSIGLFVGRRLIKHYTLPRLFWPMALCIVLSPFVYLGMTVGIHSVHYQGISEYTEQLIDIDNKPVGTLSIEDDRRITGTGYSVAFGAIIRPMENSPFRVGLSVATPTFYTLTTKNVTQLVNRVDPAQGYNPYNPNYVASGSYEFKMNTPWKFGLSLGHTVAQIAAIGAGIEYADYSHIDTREISGEYYDYWTDTYSTGSASDRQMNDHTDRTLKGVLTARIGAEIKPDPSLALRVGYNYVSPMYKSDGTKEFQIDSYGVNASSATDYTNWKATHRITCGIGYSFGPLNLSAAYQYSVTNGDFMPFMNYLDNTTPADDNVAKSVSLSNKRHQIMATIGYSF